MLQRAASNAYSWWWASHIRTKQSKWLDQNLQDMDEKVQGVLHLLQEDGDSFAKRAEMYYKKRPELISFVEEAYRAYRALAERYNHLSTDLQNANNTIASVFPDQVQFAMDDDYDIAPESRPAVYPPDMARPNVPSVPKAPVKDLKGLLATSARKLKKTNKKGSKPPSAAAVLPSKSGLSKDDALCKIDKVQKEILALQTVKEFVKSTYEEGLTKYWEIENKITGMQEEVSALQDEFSSEGMVIEDEEARRLMATAALKSCQETLSQLEEKHRKSAKEALLERERTKNSWNRIESLRQEVLPPGEIKGEAPEYAAEIEKPTEVAVHERVEESKSPEEKIEKNLVVEFTGTSLTVTEMAEKIDELVEKVISLETALASQAALTERMREDNDLLQAQIQVLEEDKGKLGSKNSEVQDEMKRMEEKLQGINILDKSIRDQGKNLQTDFTEAHLNVECLSDKLTCIKPDENEDIATTPTESETDSSKVTLQPENVCEEEKHKHGELSEETTEELKNGKLNSMPGASDESLLDVPPTSSNLGWYEFEDSWQAIPAEEQHVPQKEELQSQAGKAADALTGSKVGDNIPHVKKQGEEIDQDEPNWRELFLKGMENREKTLLQEYTSVLRNYKEAKKKLDDVDRKDEEILSLRRRVRLLQTVVDEQKGLKDPDAVNSQGANEMMLMAPDEQGPTSEAEQKLRMDIDQLLEENLEFWLRLSSMLHQIQKYGTAVEDLQAELTKLEEKEKSQDGSGSQSRRNQSSFRSEVRPIYKHLKEILTELTGWSEKCTKLKDEQHSRFSSLCNIQEEITRALKASAEDEEFTFTSYQAAKFQGEVLNMKQENNKVANELQAGLDHITALTGDVERTLDKVNEKLGLPGSKDYQNTQLQQAVQRHVPLHSFIFGTKQKKPRASIFASMSPMLHKRDHSARSGQSGPSSLGVKGRFPH
ncbi:hypothetical protein MLD38_031064 [Melastoma candidum]|uniref:Uncharacterized protein n=1 Tax=Melastoma candidum TaxID=119954 RepID=A0ACB9MNK3_9MYRT|nr:hypothetical protein MLD38_031064 [Melastoma candidum]